MSFTPDAELARRLDDEDPLAGYRERFHCPPGKRYFAGNSLGLQPKGVAEALQAELDLWASHAVDGHFEGPAGWYAYHELLREPFARLVGAEPDEVVAMNSLTVNLHLMLVSFYRPTAERYKILMEGRAFPSDTYVARTQLAHHGHDPEAGLIVSDEIEAALDEHGDEIAVVLLGGVNYFTGRLYDLAGITEAAQAKGCTVGLDLAHAAGNVPLALHDWNVDFAAWCSYKYLNGGPGAIAGCFVHRRHAERTDLPRFGGWWGNDPGTRFRMHLEPEFKPRPSADGWQLSNPPILALAPLRVSLALFDEAGMPALRRKSLALTGYLEQWVRHAAPERVELLTPADPEARGCQLSLRVLDRPHELFEALQSQGIVVDERKPDVIRVAPVPLYNSFADVHAFGEALAAWASRDR
jgi:kynureninase